MDGEPYHTLRCTRCSRSLARVYTGLRIELSIRCPRCRGIINFRIEEVVPTEGKHDSQPDARVDTTGMGRHGTHVAAND